jgi:pimeloyl-ACP methyl ester carboxylesterase
MLQPRFLSQVEEWHSRWTEQVELLRSLQVPGVVPVRDGFLGPLPHAPGHPGEGRTLYLVMNWVDGESLDEWIRHRPERDPIDDLKVLLPVAAALDLMHSGRSTGSIPIVHRDVKPANILVTEHGSVLVDFGLTRGLPTGQRLTGLEGTLGYLAPESSEQGIYSAATDRYAFGAVAYFVVTGIEPPTSHQPEVLRTLLAAVPALAERPEVVDHITDMLATDPDERPAGLANWIGQLRRSSIDAGPDILNPPAPRRHPTSPPTQRKRTTRRLSRLPTVVVLVLVVVVIGGVVGGLFGTGAFQGNTGTRTPPVAATEAGYTPKYKVVQCSKPATSIFGSGGNFGGPGVTCGYLIVPQDRSRPKGLQVRLLVLRAKATTPQPAADAVIEVGDPTEGDGPEGTSSATRLYSNYIWLTTRGDEFSVPRLNCPEVTTAQSEALAFDPLSSQALSEQATAFSTCRARLVKSGVNPNDYGYDAAAADFRDLLRVLHIRQANLLASASGSTLAYDIMRQYPDLVRTVSIEDPNPPGFGPNTDIVANTAGAFDRYTALCNADPPCRAAFPDLLGQWQRDYTRWQQSPVTAKTSPDLISASPLPQPLLIDGDSAAEALANLLFNPTELPGLASQIYSPDQSFLSKNIQAYSVVDDGLNPQGAYASYLCKDLFPGEISLDLQEKNAVEAYPQFSGAASSYQIDLHTCPVWNVQPDNASDFAPIVSDIPTFLFGGALNPNGSPAWFNQVAQGLSHVTVLIFPTLTSNSLQEDTAPACLTTLRLDFLRQPMAHLDVSHCVAQSPPIAFDGT